MEGWPVTIGPYIQDGGRGGDALEALHGAGINAVLLKRQQNPVSLFIVAHGTDGQALQTKLSDINDGASCSARDGQANFLDELDVAAVRDTGNGPSQHIKDVETDDRNIVTHISEGPCSCK
jgi:hypothetical protein